MLHLPVLIAIFLATNGDGAPADALTIDDVQVTLLADVQAPARQDGILVELRVQEGDLVSQGALLGQLDSELASIEESRAGTEFEISRLRAANDVDLRFANKSLEVAKSELARSLESVAGFPKSISKTELDRLRLVVEKTDLSIEQSVRDLREAALTKTLKEQIVAVAGKQLKDHRITAPIAGMVVEVRRQAGEWVNRGDPVVRIIRLNRLRVEAFVDSRRYGNSLTKCAVTLTTQLPPGNVTEEFRGKITFVSPEVQPVNGQALVWADVENPELKLRPGVRGTLAIDLSRPADKSKPSAVKSKPASQNRDVKQSQAISPASQLNAQ